MQQSKQSKGASGLGSGIHLHSSTQVCSVESRTVMGEDRNVLLGDDGNAYTKPHRKRTRSVSESGLSRFRKHAHMLIGFVLGFLMAFGTLLSYDRYLLLSEQRTRHVAASEYYQTGYMTALEDMATTSGGGGGGGDGFVDQTLEQRLAAEVRVLCMVLTCPKYHQERAAHVRATWGRRCSKLIFMSSEPDDDLDIVNVVDVTTDVYANLWNKTREAFRYVFERYHEEYHWFLKADDDTYIVMENLRYMLYAYNPDTPLYFGYEMVVNDQLYMSGAAYVLSREALRRFMTDAYYNETLCPAATLEMGYAEDHSMGVCLQNVGVHLADAKLTAPADNKPKILPMDLASYMEPNWNTSMPGWIFAMTPQAVELGLDCCSNYAFGFHYTDPRFMYTFEYLIYHLHPFGLQGGAEKLPLKVSAEEVARLFPNNGSIVIVD